LMNTQKQRPGENLNDWLTFFLDCLLNIQAQLMDKLKVRNSIAQLSPKEKNILAFVENRPGTKSGEIAKGLNIPLPTVKKIISIMVENKVLLKYGAGAGTNYIAEIVSPLKTGLMFKLSNSMRKTEFNFMHSGSYIEITKIILTPLFPWFTPYDWYEELSKQELAYKITCHSNSGKVFTFVDSLLGYSNPAYFQPVFTLLQPINIPMGIREEAVKLNEYPMRVEIEFTSTVSKINFDVLFVYDAVK
jgi:DNA-binding Lrp family transcriptional regulator